jgi:glycerol kinase
VANVRCILALDQGTSSTKGVLFGLDSVVRGVASVPVDLESPAAGWVQQDPEQIYQSALAAAKQLLAANPGTEIAGLAITNQRESALAWDPETGKPLSAMLGWQDRRTAERLGTFTDAQSARIREITGLPLDPMFSALKFAWILDQIDPDRSLARAGKIALGTVDSWLVYRLTCEHVVEVGNASRTQLLSLETEDWSEELLELFDIPAIALPAVVGSDHQTEVCADGPLKGLPILGVLADSHAALFAHYATNGSAVKATFGTGSSVMALSNVVAAADSGLVSTVAWGTEGHVVKAVEGNILSSGSTAVWLGEVLGKSANDLAALAEQASAKTAAGISDGSVNIVPAFGGLGAPWWDVNAKALIEGMTLGTGGAELSLAAFEAICLQIEDVLAAVESVTGAAVPVANLDGGPTANPWLMQLMANLSQRRVSVPTIAELSAVGVAVFAARAAGLASELNLAANAEYQPKATAAQALARKTNWDAAVARARFNPSSK